jgi:hypothetical protein
MTTDQEPEILTDKVAILDRIAAARRSLLSALDRVSPATITAAGSWGDWSLKDLLAHLAYWELWAAERLQEFVAGTGGDRAALDDAAVNSINDNIYQSNKDRPLADIRDVFEVAHLTLRTAVKSIPASVYTEDQQPAPLRAVVAYNSYLHDELHLADVERAADAAGPA